MWDKLGSIIGLVIGICLILFRKGFGNIIVRKQLKERTTLKTMKNRWQLKDVKGEGILHKGIEIIVIVVGMGFILLSISELFPQTNKYITYSIGFFMLSLCAATATILVEFLLLFRFLMRNVHKYTREHYGDRYRSVKNSSVSDKLNATSEETTNDPVLQALEKKAIIYSIVCFIPLFAFFLFAFYTIYRLTS